MKDRKRVFLAALAAMAVFAAMSVPAMAKDQDQLMLQDQTRLMQQIRQDTGISPELVDGLKPELRRALRVVGEGGPVRAMVRAANNDGCQGECLVEGVRLMTTAMEQGYSAEEAQRMIREEIRACVQERAETGMSDEELCLQLRSRVEARVITRARDGEGSGQGETSGLGSMGDSESGGSQSQGGGGSGGQK